MIFHKQTDIIYFPIQLLFPKMHNKHVFSPDVLYIEHEWNDVLFHNRVIFEFENP